MNNLSGDRINPETQPRTYSPSAFDNNETSPFICFMKKIWEGIKWIFEQIGNFFKNLFSPDNKNQLKLNNHEIEMIQNAKPSKKPIAPPSSEIKLPSNKKVSQMNALLDFDTFKKHKIKGYHENELLLDALDLPKQSQQLSLTQPLTKKKNAAQELPPITDPVMKDFHDTSLQFIETVLDCVFDKEIEPYLSDLKKGLGNLSNGLKFGADLAFQIGDKAGKPIFEKLKQFSIDEKSEYQNLFKWLLKEGAPKDFEQRLKESHKADFDKEEDLNQFTKICIDWIIKSDHKTSIHEAFQLAGIELKGNKEAIDKIYEGAILLLLNDKIGRFISNCNDKLDGKLSQIIRKSVVENGKKISDILVRRLINILENTKFPEMFDTLVKVGVDQTEAVIAMDQARAEEVKSQKALLEKAKHAQITKAESIEEKKAKFELLQHLKNVELAGGEEIWIAKQAEQKGLEAYRKFALNEGKGEGFCHLKIAELMLNPNLNPKQKEKIEEELFKGLADEIIPLLFPKQKVELPTGEIKEVDSLVYLCSKIDIPGEFKELAKEAVDISKEILTPDTQKIIKGIYDTVWTFAGDQIQESIANEAKEILKKGVKIGARTLFENFITPNNINDLIGEEILPYVQEKIYLAFGLEAIEHNQKQFVPLLHKLTSSDSEEGVKKQAMKEMLALITADVKAKSVLSSEVFAAVGVENFEEMMSESITDIANGILAYQESKNVHTEETVEVALDGFFQTIKVEGNPRFGQLAVNLVFKLGKFNDTAEFFSDWFKEIISEQISSVTKKLRQSPHYLLEKATKLIKAKYLDKKKVADLIFESNQKVKAKDVVDAKLKTEIEKTAKVTRDLITLKIDQLSWGKKLIAKPFVSGIVGGDEKKLTQLISTVYEKMFGNRLITHNLLVRCQEQVLKFMAKGSKKFAQGDGMKPIKVEKMPSILPELFV